MLATHELHAAAGELASTKAAGDASVGNGALLSKLPAPRKKKRPVLLTVLAESIPDSDSDVSLPHSHLAPLLILVACHMLHEDV